MTQNDMPRVEDLASVGTRISWGAITAGAMIALGIYFLLSTLAGAEGLSISEHTHPAVLQVGAIVWAFLSSVAALFVGGLVTSLLTAGEDKIEAVLYGGIMWALLVTSLIVFAAAGVRSGFNSMAVMASAQRESSAQWEASARQAGVPAATIEEWRRKAEPSDNQAKRSEASARVGWYAFAGTWISMFASAAGALVGAGPTFRIIAVKPVQRVIAV